MSVLVVVVCWCPDKYRLADHHRGRSGNTQTQERTHIWCGCCSGWTSYNVPFVGLWTPFISVWPSGYVPADWHDGILVTLYKGRGNRDVTLLTDRRWWWWWWWWWRCVCVWGCCGSWGRTAMTRRSWWNTCQAGWLALCGVSRHHQESVASFRSSTRRLTLHTITRMWCTTTWLNASGTSGRHSELARPWDTVRPTWCTLMYCIVV